MKTYKQMTSLFHRAVRKELLDGLFLCTIDERHEFKLLHGALGMTTAEVVGKLSLHSLSLAMEQVQCILDKKKIETTQETYTVIDSAELEGFINQVYGICLSIPSAERWGAGEHAYDISGTLYPSEVRTLDELSSGTPASYDVCRIMLEKMSIDGHIAPGDYLVKVRR